MKLVFARKGNCFIRSPVSPTGRMKQRSTAYSQDLWRTEPNRGIPVVSSSVHASYLLISGGPSQPWFHWRPRRLGLLYTIAFLLTFCCHEWPWNSCTTDSPSGYPKAPRWNPPNFWVSASTGLDRRFLGRQITTEAIRQTSPPRFPDKQANIDDDFLEDEGPLEIWGDLDDRRMVLSTAPSRCTAALRQAFNAALRRLVDRGVRNQLLLKYKLPLSFGVDLQGASPAWPKLQDLREQDLLREVLEGRVLRVATVVMGSPQVPRPPSFNDSFLREIVDEIDFHYSRIQRPGEVIDRHDRQGRPPIQIDYVVKASTAVALQALDAGQAHMTDINMVLSHNPFNGITMSSRYSRSDQVMTQSTSVIVKSDTNIASLPALRDAIFLSVDQEGRTVMVDNTWNHRSLARVLPQYTIYELLCDKMPGSQLVDVILDEEAVAATVRLPLQWFHQSMRHFVIGSTYALGALFLLDQHGSKCFNSSGGRKPIAAVANSPGPAFAKPREDPVFSSLRKELNKSSLNRRHKKYYMNYGNSGRHGDGQHGQGDGEDSYPSTPGPWSNEPLNYVGETELLDSLRTDAREPLASGRRYYRTRALHDSYNAALVQLLHNSVLDRFIEDLQEINVVPFFDCGGTVPGSVARNFPPPHSIPQDDALMDVLHTGVVLVGMPMGSKTSGESPEVLYAQRAMVQVVAAIGAEYRTPLQTRFIRLPTAQHVLRALHRGLIHFADARVLFEYVEPQTHLGFRVRPTCALGASRLWMMTQNKSNMTSLEELHKTLEKNLDARERRVAVVDQRLWTTVSSVLPPGVGVDVMIVEEAAEALLSRSVVAVFGMSTQQRRHLRCLVNAARNNKERDEREWDRTPGGALFDTVGDSQGGSPLATPLVEDFPVNSDKSPVFPESVTVSVERFPSEGRSKDGSKERSPDVSPAQDTGDFFQELLKGKGFSVGAAECSQLASTSWIEVDTGITAVMHSFVALSLRPQRTNG